jgi:hypothetical protein
VTTQSHPHPQRSETMPPVDKGAAAPEQKPGEIPVDTLSRARHSEDFAAVGGADQDGQDGPEGMEATDTERAEERPSIEPADADRFAMAFRPSWAPLAGASEAKPAQRIDRAPRGEQTPRVATITHDEPLTVPGLHRKRRAAIWASASVASFLALTYWGVSSTTKTPHEAALRPISSAPASSHAIQPVPVPAPEETALAASPASAGNAERVPSGPRLEPPVEPAKPETEQAVATATEPAAPAQAETAGPANPTPQRDPPPATAATAPKRQEPAQATPAQAIAAPAAPSRQGAQAPAARTAPPPSAAATPAPNSERAALAARPDATPLHPRNPLLSVHAVPDNVRLWLDGQRMSNPFGVRLPRGSKHRIEARADGYETSAQTVRIESDAKLTIAVKRAPPPTPRARAVQAVPSNVRDDRAKPVDKRKRGAGFVVVSPY